MALGPNVGTLTANKGLSFHAKRLFMLKEMMAKIMLMVKFSPETKVPKSSVFTFTMTITGGIDTGTS